MELVRNFSIIAHIDHGKSTLADRMLDATGAVTDREKKDQLLDNMDLERERGITIKAQTVRLAYKHTDGKTYQLNLIDTPGHVDFHYEVSRSLAACDGALLVVDAAQGCQAQTLANVYLALENDLEILPVLNKIDLPQANPQGVKEQIEEIIGIEAQDALEISAKSGMGVEAVLGEIVEKISPPKGNPDAPLKALIFDSWFDSYRGVVVLIRIIDGSIKKGDKLLMMATEKEFECHDVGVNAPFPTNLVSLNTGEVGYLVTGLKELVDIKIGDTVTDRDKPATEPCVGFQVVKSMVFSGIFPTDPVEYEALKDSLAKLQLNDASFSYEPETSLALGFGYRCGFLGLLHMGIIQERLEREYDLDLISTAPTVVHRVHTKDNVMVEIDSPAKMPEAGDIDFIEEPIILATIYVPKEFLGPVIKLCEDKRGVQKKLGYVGMDRAVLEYELPLSEVVLDFFDKLKSMSRGYASMDYELTGFRAASLVKLDILVAKEPVDALSIIVHKDRSYERGQLLVAKMKELIPRQQFDVPIQAAIGTKVISRATIKAFRKNVTAKCYGGDISRKRKLLEKQKKGKKRMKQIGNVEIPQTAFLAVLNLD